RDARATPSATARSARDRREARSRDEGTTCYDRPMAPKPLEYNATLVQRIDVTDQLALFRVQPDNEPARPWFTPGQYCVLGLNNEEKPELGSVRRSMSIASAPTQDGPIEFYIRFVSKPESENPLTHLLWKRQTGDRVYMRPVAAGVFTVKDCVGENDSR